MTPQTSSAESLCRRRRAKSALGIFETGYAAAHANSKFSGLHPATKDTCREKVSDSGDLFVWTMAPNNPASANSEQTFVSDTS